MPGAVRPVLAAGDAFAFTDGLHRGWYQPDHQRRTIMFTLSNGRRARGCDYFSFQPWFLQPNYLDGVSQPAKAFYARYMEEYGQEIAEVSGLLKAHPSGLDIARRELSNSSTSLPEAARAWAADQQQAARL